MAKAKTKFICQTCGYEAVSWMGKCSSCNSWNSFVEEQTAEVKTQYIKSSENGSVLPITDVITGQYQRLVTKICEFDRVLGGGFVDGSVTLLGGDPGIGKSTISLQLANQLAQAKNKILYVSGEESLEQLRMRGERLAALSENILLFAETNVFEIEKEVK